MLEMKAIILAAGSGKRMYPLAQDIPKCLLTINGETILARQIRILKSCGISDIAIVTGFRRKKIEALYKGEARIFYNPIYRDADNAYSLCVAKGFLTNDCIILNADILYSDRPIRALLADKHIYCLVVDNRAMIDSDAMKVKVVGDNIIEVNKTIPVGDAYGVAVGIAKVQGEGIPIFKHLMSECIKGDYKANWPTIYQTIASKGYLVKFILIGDSWIEYDTRENYKDACLMFSKGG